MPLSRCQRNSNIKVSAATTHLVSVEADPYLLRGVVGDHRDLWKGEVLVTTGWIVEEE